MKSPEILILVGPTGVGKSALAMEWAVSHEAAILSMDSMQVYRGMEIGTSKPTDEERTKVTHGGLDLVMPTESFDVARYLVEAERFLKEYRNRFILVVGGTGLYFRALTQGLCEVPSIPQEIQEQVRQLSLDQLQQELLKKDPLILEVLDRQNPRRLQRALEVIEATGTSLREWQRRNSIPLISRFQAFFLQREDLRERIGRRVREMWRRGWPEEVRGLMELYGAEAVDGFSAIGYAEIARWILSGGSQEEVQERIATETWQYARRQLTWFRRESSVRPLELSNTFTMTDFQSQIQGVSRV